MGISVSNPTSTRQVFSYTRQVGDTGTIVISLPYARASSSYNVVATMGEFTDLLVIACPPSLYTATQFTMKLSSPPSSGDTFLFVIEDIT